MGAKSSKDVTSQEVKNYISQAITTNTTNITNILNKTVNDTTNEIVQQNISSTTNTNGNANSIVADNITATGASTLIDINQNIDSSIINQAVITIANSQEQLQSLAQQIQSQLNNSVTTNADLQTALQNTAALKKADTNEGGVEAIIASLTAMVPTSLVNSSDIKKVESKVLNDLKINVTTNTINNNDIKNIVENITKNMISQINQSTCANSVSTTNTLLVRNITASDGGKISINQSQMVKSLSSCMISSDTISQMATDMTVKAETTSTSSTIATASAAASASTTTSMEASTTKGSALETMFSDIASNFTSAYLTTIMLPLLGIICCCLMLFILIFLLLKFSKKNNNNENNDDNGDNGENNETSDYSPNQYDINDLETSE